MEERHADLAPVSLLAKRPSLLIVHSSLPIQTMTECPDLPTFIEQAGKGYDYSVHRRLALRHQKIGSRSVRLITSHNRRIFNRTP